MRRSGYLAKAHLVDCDRLPGICKLRRVRLIDLLVDSEPEWKGIMARKGPSAQQLGILLRNFG